MSKTTEAAEEYEKDMNTTMIQMSQIGCPHKDMRGCSDSCKYSIKTNKGLKVCLLFLCTKFVAIRQHEILMIAAKEGKLPKELSQTIKNITL